MYVFMFICSRLHAFHIFVVICLIHPWLHMSRDLQLSQLQALSTEILHSCASRLAHEAKVPLSQKKRRTKATLSQFILLILRSSLLAIEHGTTSISPTNVLVHLRLTPNPAILHNSPELLRYFQALLEPPVFAAFTVDSHLSSEVLSKCGRYCKRTVNQSTHPPPPCSLPPVTDWPRVVPQHTMINCCRNYFNGTVWVKPQTCAVCARARFNTKMKLLLLPSADDTFSLFNALRIPMSSTLHNSQQFLFNHPSLDNVMLCSDGISTHEDGVEICVCNDCYSPLVRSPHLIPKFALKNNLYRGVLPETLHDITWVEEQVCALFRSMAIVTPLYGSDDPAQPYVFRGNTCAFAQNMLSTAKKLPRTPSDVNDLLSVVFTGAAKNVPDSCLKNVFRM